MLTGIPLLLIILLAVALIVVASSVLKLHPFLALLLVSILTGVMVGIPLRQVLEAVNQGFGGLMSSIGMVVVLGSLIGVVLEKSGATLQIAQGIISLFGKKQPILAISVIGAVVGIPIFCDSGFIILSGLTRPLARQTKASFAGISLGLAGGLYTTHTLLPPHPGPLAVTASFNLTQHLGTVILLGLLLAIPTTLIVFLLASWLGKRISIELAEESTTNALTERLPALWHSLLPIVVPIGLLALASFADIFGITGNWKEAVLFAGSPVIALLTGLFLALSLVKPWNKTLLTDWLGTGVQQAGTILILTGAGGSFGNILRKTPIADMVSQWITETQTSGLVFLLVAFAIGALLKTAQGSTTSAMIITSSILAPLLVSVGFQTPVQLTLLLSAIGAGGMTVSHANDSYFWVISQFSGFTLRDGYRGVTLMTLFQGVSVLVFTLLAYVVIV